MAEASHTVTWDPGREAGSLELVLQRLGTCVRGSVMGRAGRQVGPQSSRLVGARVRLGTGCL